MKIGIFTLHGTTNYGGALQVYGDYSHTMSAYRSIAVVAILACKNVRNSVLVCTKMRRGSFIR